MRRLILGFALAAPWLLLLLWRFSPPAAIGVLALSHALLFYPTLHPNAQWWGPVATCFETRSKELWLTIDDGPTDDTGAMLEVLAERGVAATFFVKGALVRRRPELVREIVARGHGVANHSETHPAGVFWCLSPAAIARQIDGCSNAIEETIGERPRWFRAPVGMKNPFVHPALESRGMRLIGWSVRGFDTVDGDVERIAARIVPRVAAGSIVVMHQGREFSARCVARVVDELRARGYAFVIPPDDRLKTKR